MEAKSLLTVFYTTHSNEYNREAFKKGLDYY